MNNTITDKHFHKLLRNAYGLNDLKQYGGAFFSIHCTECGGKAEMPDTLNVNRFMAEYVGNKPRTIQGKCRKCGPIQLPFIGFEDSIFS